ncbi:calmodulin-lysine N-methyltransferase-like isoform X2 [Neocloeon triangulifer]|nr:calmodulin-lysine N-methyltransferase-like isoform X2 [Neocloeon triangulifer]XP_059478046.1 calmodulin-lysine N-methyltransferase-like isoform X2 [Neocloeon triangulifer]XP_059478055.1 calmodulin-lysine N-methyltransferase-like isoform X2 [Neocloeon triangulifer]
MSGSLVALGTDDIGQARHEAARQRWRLLAEALKRGASHDGADSCMGVSFGLVRCSPTPEDGWFLYSAQGFEVLVCHVSEAVSPKALAGFNNTGNVRVWSSEEVLTHYCLRQGPALFAGRRVIELGGGMTCLAGLMVAKAVAPAHVHLTDGNTAAMANVKRIVAQNELRTDVACSVLRWHEVKVTAAAATYDFVLCADCLFFDEARPALAQAIDLLLKPGGSALVMAPARGGTFNLFVQEAARKGLRYSIARRYDDAVWASHEALAQAHLQGGPFYDEDLHYPLLLVLTKPS